MTCHKHIKAIQILAFVFASGLTISSSLGPQQEAGCSGEPRYSSAAQDTQGGASVWAPDHTKRLSIEWIESSNGTMVGVYTVTAGRNVLTVQLNGFDSEVLWSPDSSAFAVNQTEGGGGIGQRSYLFYLTENGLRKLDISVPVEKVFGSPVKCDVPVPPNIAVLKWLSPDRVLVVAEVVPVSICECSGTFMTYEVLVPAGRILRSYTQTETKKLFGDSLGCELRGENNCAKLWQRSVDRKGPEHQE